VGCPTRTTSPSASPRICPSIPHTNLPLISRHFQDSD
jgi:hypothetical protein